MPSAETNNCPSFTPDDPSVADENDVFVYSGPVHEPEIIATASSEIQPVMYQPPPDRWQYLPRSAAIFTRGQGQWHAVMLGDSIVNDTSRSRWGDLLQTCYPRCRIIVTTVVRGSTGCWWYKEPGRVARYVLAQHPDLLIIGGISHKNDIAAIREVIQQVRAALPCDILLMTGAFGHTDPRDDQQWTFDISTIPDDYRARLRDLAGELQLGFLDMTAHWGRYIRASRQPLEWFKRDAIHANARGEQVLGHILAAHLAPPVTTK